MVPTHLKNIAQIGSSPPIFFENKKSLKPWTEAINFRVSYTPRCYTTFASRFMIIHVLLVKLRGSVPVTQKVMKITMIHRDFHITYILVPGSKFRIEDMTKSPI